jgi:hypothetical protein
VKLLSSPSEISALSSDSLNILRDYFFHYSEQFPNQVLLETITGYTINPDKELGAGGQASVYEGIPNNFLNL